MVGWLVGWCWAGLAGWAAWEGQWLAVAWAGGWLWLRRGWAVAGLRPACGGAVAGCGWAGPGCALLGFTFGFTFGFTVGFTFQHLKIKEHILKMYSLIFTLRIVHKIAKRLGFVEKS